MDKDELLKMIEAQYFSPNVKFEVIMQALLIPIIGDIVSEYSIEKDRVYFLGEEMPYKNSNDADNKTDADNKNDTDDKNDNDNNECPKIDFVLGSAKQIYLVELKTSSGSIKKKQIDSYKKYLSNQTFNKKILHLLISILKNKYNIRDGKEIDKENMHDLSELVQTIMHTNCNKKKYGPYNSKDVAIFLRDNDKKSTAKYLYFAEKLIENADLAGIGETAFNEKLKMIYITPDVSDNKKLYNNGFDSNFLCGHIALKEIPSKFADKNDKTWPIVKQLIRNIYKKPENE